MTPAVNLSAMMQISAEVHLQLEHILLRTIQVELLLPRFIVQTLVGDDILSGPKNTLESGYY